MEARARPGLRLVDEILRHQDLAVFIEDFERHTGCTGPRAQVPRDRRAPELIRGSLSHGERTEAAVAFAEGPPMSRKPATQSAGYLCRLCRLGENDGIIAFSAMSVYNQTLGRRRK